MPCHRHGWHHGRCQSCHVMRKMDLPRPGSEPLIIAKRCGLIDLQLLFHFICVSLSSSSLSLIHEEWLKCVACKVVTAVQLKCSKTKCSWVASALGFMTQQRVVTDFLTTNYQVPGASDDWNKRRMIKVHCHHLTDFIRTYVLEWHVLSALAVPLLFCVLFPLYWIIICPRIWEDNPSLYHPRWGSFIKDGKVVPASVLLQVLVDSLLAFCLLCLAHLLGLLLPPLQIGLP